MKLALVFIAAFLTITACATKPAGIRAAGELVVSNITSDYKLSDLNDYGCPAIGPEVLKKITQKGTRVSEREVHDNYSTTGCSVKGSLEVNGRRTTFSYDHGGLLRLGNGMTLGCGENCCTADYPFCSWEGEENQPY